jgi:3-oxoadipate enol-lactonase
MDHRGHGRGIRSRRPFRLQDCADDVVAMADAMETDRFIPVGYSMGGPIAQLVWRRHRDRVSGLVLCATSRRFAGSDVRQRAMFGGLFGLSMASRLAPAEVRRRLVMAAMNRRPSQVPLNAWAIDELSRHDPAELLQAGYAIGGFDSRPWIHEVDVPTAVVVTRQDQVVSPRYQLALAESIPNATVHMVEGSHSVCVERPGRFVPVLIDACRSVSQRAAATARR